MERRLSRRPGPYRWPGVRHLEKGKQGLYDGRGAEHLHYAFQIDPDEYDDYLSRLKALGVEVIEHEWSNGHRSLYFFDHDGHQGELMTCDWLELFGPD